MEMVVVISTSSIIRVEILESVSWHQSAPGCVVPQRVAVGAFEPWLERGLEAGADRTRQGLLLRPADFVGDQSQATKLGNVLAETICK